MAWFGDWFGDWFGSWFGDSGGNTSFAASALVVTLSTVAPTVDVGQAQVSGGSRARGKKIQRAPKPVIANVAIKADAQTVYVFGFAPKAAVVANRVVKADPLAVGWVGLTPRTLATKTAIAKPDAVKIRAALENPSVNAIKNASIKAPALGASVGVQPVNVKAEQGQDEAEVLAVLMLSGFLD